MSALTCRQSHQHNHQPDSNYLFERNLITQNIISLFSFSLPCIEKKANKRPANRGVLLPHILREKLTECHSQPELRQYFKG